MQTLVFATSNPNKLIEVQGLVGGLFKIVTLADIGFFEDIPEPFDSLVANSLHKCETVHNRTGMDCIAEDTGLEVVALGGRPGVRSARFAGEGSSDKENMDKLLREMDGIMDRNARFRTVVTLILNGEVHQFEGVCDGVIGLEPRGAKGFGYDPVFYPNGSNVCFAEMDKEQKGEFSHRGKAIRKLVEFLVRV